MISEGSCDTEDWSNDAENSALTTVINYILQYSNREQLFLIVIFHNITVFTAFWTNECSFGEQKRLLSKT